QKLGVVGRQRVYQVRQFHFVAAAAQVVTILGKRLEAMVAHALAQARLDQVLFALVQADAATSVDQVDDECVVVDLLRLCRHTSVAGRLSRPVRARRRAQTPASSAEEAGSLRLTIYDLRLAICEAGGEIGPAAIELSAIAAPDVSPDWPSSDCPLLIAHCSLFIVHFFGVEKMNNEQ